MGYSSLRPIPPIEWPAPLALLLYGGFQGTATAYGAAAMAIRDLPAATTSLGLLTTPVVNGVAAIVLVLGGVAIGATGGRQ